MKIPFAVLLMYVAGYLPAVAPIVAQDAPIGANGVKTLTGPNQFMTVYPGSGAQNSVFPAYSGAAIHDLTPGSEGSRYRNCLYQKMAHDTGIVDTSACAWNHVTFDSMTNADAGNQMLRLDTLSSYGKGFNYSSVWRVVSMHQDMETLANRGIGGGYNIFYTKRAAGDSNVLNMYSYFDSGWNTQSDEGMTGIRNYVTQNQSYWHGTSLSVGVGLTMPLLSDSTAASAVGEDNNHVTDGGILVDISKGTISGTVTGGSTPLAGSGYLNTFATGGGLPVTTAWGVCSTAIPSNNQLEVNVPFTCVVTLKAGAFTAGGLVWVAGPNYPEQAPITAVGPVTGGTQSITISVRNPQPTPGANIFQGPATGPTLTGQYLSADANLAQPAAMRTTYYAFGSLDGVNLIYGFFLQGGSAQMIGCDAQAFCPGVAGRNGFHLYPGAEVIANHSLNHDPELEPNTIPFATGDLLEAPQPVAIYMTGLKMQCMMATPVNGGGSVCDNVVVGGQGMVSNFYPHYTVNRNDPGMYGVNGGLYQGMIMHRITGYFDRGMTFDIMPGKALFDVTAMNYHQFYGDGKTGSTSAQLFSLPHGRISWDDTRSMLSTDNLGSVTYIGPASAPIGPCPAAQVGQWEFSQDGHISFCAPAGSAGLWVTKM